MRCAHLRSKEFSLAKKKTSVIDGFASVQAVKRSGRTSKEARTRPSASRLPDNAGAGKRKSSPKNEARIGQTAMPARHELVCYSCDYAFTVQGRIHFYICPKCKHELDTTDHVINDKWSLDIKTMGSIEIKPGAVLEPVTLVAQNIIVAGDAKKATLQITRHLELCEGAAVDLGKITMRDLVIRPGATFVTKRKMNCRQIDIGGTLKAKLRAEDRIIIRKGARFTGELYTPRLIVEDGARISAATYLGSAMVDVQQEPRSAA